MLALFKDSPASPMLPPIAAWARLQWRLALDKGAVPALEGLRREWLREYAELTFPQEEIELLMHRWEGDWLVPLLQRSAVREIFAHGPQLVEAVGTEREILSCPLEEEDWRLWVETLATRLGAECNFGRPCTSTHWKAAGAPWRVTLLHGSLGPTGMPKVFLRRLSVRPLAWGDYQLDEAGAKLLGELVAGRANVLVAGATGSGKTSFLSTMLAARDEEDHLVVLEDTQEIACEGARVTRLLSADRPGRALTDLLAHSLRLSPDRIVLGEMRSHEVVPFLLAMNTGHSGVMATLHASGAADALHRVAQLFTLASGRGEMSYAEVLRLVCRNVGVVVFLEKRRIREVVRVYGCEGSQPLYDVIWS